MKNLKRIFTIHLAAAVLAFPPSCCIAAQEVTDSTAPKILMDAVKTDKVIVLTFYADWCHVCTKMKPMLDAVEGKYKNKVIFVRVNVDKASALSQNVRAVPTTLIGKGKKALKIIEGLPKSQADMEKVIDSFGVK